MKETHPLVPSRTPYHMWIMRYLYVEHPVYELYPHTWLSYHLTVEGEGCLPTLQRSPNIWVSCYLTVKKEGCVLVHQNSPTLGSVVI